MSSMTNETATQSLKIKDTILKTYLTRKENDKSILISQMLNKYKNPNKHTICNSEIGHYWTLPYDEICCKKRRKLQSFDLGIHL